MNMRGWLLGGLGAILATACSHRTVAPPSSLPLAPAPTAAAETTAPLPAQTPYDGKAQARAQYLENYARGYSSTFSVYASPGCLCTAEGDAELYEAATNGFFAGRDAGAAARARQQRPAPVEGAPASATSPARPQSSPR